MTSASSVVQAYIDVCDVCCSVNIESNHNTLYGGWMSSRGVDAHYFCLLSAKAIPQNGEDTEGMLGFLPEDVLSSAYLYRDIECCFCGKFSAAVKCANPDCSKTWHYKCGTRNYCITVMSGSFDSYCGNHVPDLNEGRKHSVSDICGICFDRLGTYHPATSIISSCCLHVDFYKHCFNHKKCVMEYTRNAGYDSMCINCCMIDVPMTKEKWQEEMRQKGIFIPMEKATWEADGRFDDQVMNKCEQENCPMPTYKYNVWCCFVCGCFPRHLRCAGVKSAEEYFCMKCIDQSFVLRVPLY